MDQDKTRVKPTRLPNEGDKTRITDPQQSESVTAKARTKARAGDGSKGKGESASHTLSRTVRAGSDEAATELSSSEDDLARTLNITGDMAATAVSDPDLPSKVIRRDSIFSDLKNRIEREYPDKISINDRFVLLETLGSGGMGNVYLAKDMVREEMGDSDTDIAIKVLNDECRNLPGALQALQQEAKKAQTLSHPNIVTVYDFDRDRETGSAFITMEYIEGDSLKGHLRKLQRIPHSKAMHVIERIARGLAYAHQQGFVHADIKPANIFLGDSGAVKILDFGIAKAFTEAAKEQRSLADDLTEGALTPSYASLEMLRGHRALPSDDVYSLACMSYEIISGRHPFIGTDGLPMPADVAAAKGAKVEPIQGVPRRHMKALRRGLEFERSQRYKDAGEFIDAIKARNWKKDIALLTTAAAFTGIMIFAVNQGLEQVVPSVESLKPELSQVAESIKDGDELLASGDIDFAHRLYSQAWEVANDLTVNDVAEREKAHAILQDRRKKVSEFIIQKSEDAALGEYQLRELYVALEFLLKDDIGGNERRIQRALDSIERRIDKLAE